MPSRPVTRISRNLGPIKLRENGLETRSSGLQSMFRSICFYFGVFSYLA